MGVPFAEIGALTVGITICPRDQLFVIFVVWLVGQKAPAGSWARTCGIGEGGLAMFGAESEQHATDFALTVAGDHLLPHSYNRFGHPHA
jgi:hypothetical protein